MISQSIDDQSLKKVNQPYLEQQESINHNHAEPNSAAMFSSNKQTVVPISVHQIPHQVQEEAERNSGDQKGSNLFKNIDEQSREVIRIPSEPKGAAVQTGRLSPEIVNNGIDEKSESKECDYSLSHQQSLGMPQIPINLPLSKLNQANDGPVPALDLAQFAQAYNLFNNNQL